MLQSKRHSQWQTTAQLLLSTWSTSDESAMAIFRGRGKRLTARRFGAKGLKFQTPRGTCRRPDAPVTMAARRRRVSSCHNSCNKATPLPLLQL